MEIFDEKIVRLIQLYLSGALSGEEQQELERWIDRSERNRQFFEEMKRDGRFVEEFPEFCRIDMERGWNRFERHIQQEHRNSWRQILKYVAAVVIPMAIGCSVWLLNREGKNGILPVSEMIEPGQMKAILELPGGKMLALKDMKQGEIEVDKGLKAMQTARGLVYDSSVIVKMEEVKYNTLKIPRGGEFRLTLSDGTQVILNSATTLKYPVVFGKQEREVYLDGEAYFEVETDSTRPFHVVMDGMRVQVYGTSFNVNMHQAKEIQTVLLEGKVGIKTSASREYILKPGELIRFDRESGMVEIRSVDARQYTAWTKGIFTFEEETLEQIMTTLSLWYDVDVFYQTEAAKGLHFSGHLERYKEIRNILDAITEATGVKFLIKERTIIVSQ